MASKNKLNKNKNQNSKPKGPPKLTNEGTIDTISADDSNSKFEVELLWCIQQLELLLSENKLNPARSKIDYTIM